jgi:hypothetical protein
MIDPAFQNLYSQCKKQQYCSLKFNFTKPAPVSYYIKPQGSYLNNRKQTWAPALELSDPNMRLLGKY